jgi:hypothetical protein
VVDVDGGSAGGLVRLRAEGLGRIVVRDSEQIQVTKTVDASPEELFALLSTPSRHIELDGSSMMRGLNSGCAKIDSVGDEFIMNMHNEVLGDYQMRNTVVVCEKDRTIGWAPELYPPDGYPDKIGNIQARGHTFTWDLELAESGHTKITHTYDWSKVTDEGFRGLFPMLNEQQLNDSIDRAARVAR